MIERECNRDELLYNYGNEWLTSHPDDFTAGEGAHSTQLNSWMDGWMGPRASGHIGEKLNLKPLQGVEL